MPCRVKIKQKGGNSSVVNGKELLKEGEAVGKHEDKVDKSPSIWTVLKTLIHRHKDKVEINKNLNCRQIDFRWNW